MNHEALGSEVVDLAIDFLAKSAKSVVLLRLGPAGEILEANPAFRELFPGWKRGDTRKVEDFLQPCDSGEDSLPSHPLVTYRLLESVFPGATLAATRVVVSGGSVLIGERLLPASVGAINLLSATTSELARLNREGQKNYRGSLRALHDLEVRYKLLVESTEQGMLWFDAEGQVLEANPAALRILGQSEPSHALAVLMKAVDEAGLPLALESHPVIHSLRTGQPQLGVVLGIGDGATWVLLDALPEPHPGGASPRMLCATFSDITERKQTELALRHNQTMLARTEQVAHVGSWEWEVATDRVVWSEELFRILHRDPAAGAPSFAEQGILYHPDDMALLERAVEAALKDGTPYEVELRALWPSGETRICLARGHAELDSEGKYNHLYGSLQDVTETRRAAEEKLRLQAQLQQSQKLESLGTLAGGLAHDMNNVLGAILGLASAHLDTQPPGSSLHRALVTICKATERGGQMVKNLLRFARQSPAELRELDLNGLLREEISLLERTILAQVRLRLELEPHLRPVLGDASALSAALMNLCVNAVDAMPGEGLLTLHTRNVDPDWIEVVVEDSGTGMPREVLEKALDPFYTTKEAGKGTGLGLPMVYSTMQAHHGDMRIESEPGRGTRVVLRFPTCQVAAAPAAPLASGGQLLPGKVLEVLLVDDDELIQSSMQAILEVLGHRVHSAQSGEGALALVEAGYEPALVILDMNMPGLGGAGTLPRLRSLLPRVPVLLSTGRADQSAATLVATHPGVTLLSKPFGLKELQKKLGDLGLS